MLSKAQIQKRNRLLAGNKPRTKAEYIRIIDDLSKKWHIPKQITGDTLAHLSKEYDRILVQMNVLNMTKRQGARTIANGLNQQMARRNGILVRQMLIKDLSIEDYKYHLLTKPFNDIIKLEVQRRKRGENSWQIEPMTIEEFLNWIAGYEFEYEWEVLSMTRYTIPMSGGCYCKSGFSGGDTINGFKFNWITVKTSDGDCVFANFIKDSGFSGKKIKMVRKDLKIGDGNVFIGDIEMIAEYFDCHLKLWVNDGEQIRFEEFNIQGKHLSRQLLNKSHYWRLTEDPFPIEKQLRVDLKKITSNEISEYKVGEFIIKKESEFESFQDMSKQIHETNKNVLIMGAGGTGKSTLCREIVQYNENEYVITSTMSNSARLIGGQTIHMIMSMSKNKQFAGQLLNKTLIIDEIGYLDGSAYDDVVNMIASVRFKKIIMFGDLLQLPPCQSDIYGYFFQAMEYENINKNMMRIELEIIKRTDNQEFIQEQQKIRIGDYSTMVSYFQDNGCLVDSKYQIDFNKQMVLVPTNALMDKYNNDAIEQLIKNNEQRKYDKIIGFDRVALMRIYDNDEVKVKKFIVEESNKFDKKGKKTQTFIQDAKIVFTENYDFNNGLTNGRVGKITKLEENTIEVEVEGKRYKICRSDKVRRGKVVYRTKFPFKIAYAMTIHKSQGLTINQELVVDLAGLFEKQQLYVAISRVTDHKLLKIKNMPERYQHALKKEMDNDVLTFINDNEFACFQTKMLIDIYEKQMMVRKYADTKLVNLNTIYMDFETAFRDNKYGSKKQVGYLNSIQYWKDYQIKDTQLVTDFKLNDREIEELNEQGCKSVYQEDPELYSLNYLLNIISQYKQKIKGFKQINDNKSIEAYRKYIPTLVAHNGSGFDLFFLLKQMMKMKEFGTVYGVKNIFKGSHLVFFQLVDKQTNQVVFKSWDSCQYTTLSLEKSLDGFVPDEAKKLGFHDEIVYIAKNYGYNPDILKEGQSSTVTYNKVMRTEEVTDKDILQMTDESIEYYLFECQDSRSYRFEMQKEVNLREGLLKYALNDTTTLPILCLKLEQIALDMVGCSCFNFLTFGSYTWYGLLQNLPKEAIDGKTYDSNRHSKYRTKNGVIKSKLYKNEQLEEDFVRDSVYGGQSKPNGLKLQFDKYGYYIYCDISGMYCDIMLKRDVPYGQKVWLSKPQLSDILKWLNKIESYKGTKLFKLTGDIYEKKVLELIKDQPLDILDAEFEENAYSLNPVVQYKDKQGNILKTRYKNERRRQKVSILSLIQIVLKGGQIYELFNGIRYECKGKILAPWVQKCLNQKIAGKQMNKKASNENKDILKQNPNIDKNQLKNEKCGQAYVTSGKTGANACYGQTIKQDRHETTIFADQYFDCDDFHTNYQLRNIFLVNDQFDLIVARKKIDYRDFKTSRCSQIGCYVLEWSRFMIQCIYQTINPEQDIEKQPLTGDTDSLLIREDLVIERLIPNGWMQDLSGKLTDELAGDDQWYFGDASDEQIRDPRYYKFVRVFKGIFPQPKTLAIKYKKPIVKKCDDCDKLNVDCNVCFRYKIENKCDKCLTLNQSCKKCIIEKVGEKIRSKGISITSIVNGSNETLSYQLFEQLYNAGCAVEMDLPERIKIQKPENIRKDQMNKEGFEETAYNCVQLNITRKMFNTQYTGRVLVDNQWFIPYGHISLKQDQEPQKKMTVEEQEEYDAMKDCFDDEWY